jgi:hypothetical protein
MDFRMLKKKIEHSPRLQGRPSRWITEMRQEPPCRRGRPGAGPCLQRYTRKMQYKQ